MPLKPYGLRPGDGQKSRRRHGRNSFDQLWEEGGPRGNHAESKIHDQRRLVHRQARQDAKREVRRLEDEHLQDQEDQT